MAEWRLLYATAATGTLLGELPFLSAQHTDALNGQGSWSAEVPYDDPDTVLVPDLAGGLDVVDRSSSDLSGLTPWETVVYFERDGVILGAGIVVAIDLDFEAGTMAINGVGLGGYLARRNLGSTTWVNADQGLIARSIVDQMNSGQSIDFTWDVISTGVMRDRTYVANESKPALEAIEQLAEVENGFDFRFRAHRESGSIVRHLHLEYPATGRITDIVFEVGVNCAILGYSEDGASMVTNVAALGAGEGSDKLTLNVSRPPTSELPRLDASISHVDVTKLATLEEHAQRRLLRGSGPIRRVTLTMVPDTIPLLGSFDVGDRVYVRVSRGWLNVADYFRIVELSISVGDDGEKVALTLAGQEAFG